MELVGKKREAERSCLRRSDGHAKDFRNIVWCLSRGMINFDLNGRLNEATVRKTA